MGTKPQRGYTPTELERETNNPPRLTTELELLEQLRCQREKWAPRMPETLFSPIARQVRDAIMRATDPKDAISVLDASGNAHGVASTLAVMMNTPPMREDSVLHRIHQLVQHKQGARANQMAREVTELIQAGNLERALDAVKLFNLETQDDPSEVGVFSGSLSLNDPAPEEEEVDRIVKGVLYPGGISALGGEGGLGKSWLAIHLGLCVAAGDFWLGMQARMPRRVGYISLEMPGEVVRQRIKMLTGGKFPAAARGRFHYITNNELGNVDIMNPTFHLSLISWVAEKKLDVIIVDPLRNSHRMKENDSTELAEVLRAYSEIGCAVLLLHHVSKESGQLRGNSALRDRCDAVLILSQKESGELRLSWNKRSRFDAVGSDFEIDMVLQDNRMDIIRMGSGEDPWADKEDAA